MPTHHASAVLTGRTAVLIRGASGAGKSRLAFALIEAGRQGVLRFARLVGDDRVVLQAMHGRLLARPPQELEGLIEIRGVGIRRLSFEPVARIGLVIDLGSPGAERLPRAEDCATAVEGITLPRLAVAAADAGLPALIAFLRTQPAGN